ncbi:beta-D-glucosyl crocetin beta-1,6-glucosyltransferase-like [Salvia hispanica]|uniref:beta-D-glucosyl crocetin beta-1,6-glucosyltransferase-like n=1 Tax=Salvia hispanica TaxID=49212 RepID=UPI0020094428|nr:beta-D-glucosyl crocetin beta-1,6-glucosyltransferase-like [Salvia hispanica]
MASNTPSLRILMFPWIAHSHLFPFLELAKKLSSRNFHIHFCSTPINLACIKNNLPNSIELVELNLPSLPDLPPHYHTNKNVPPHLMPLLLQAFQMSAPVFTGIVASLEPDLLIYDAFQPWAAKAAATYNIPAVFFSTTNSTSLAFFHHMHTHKNCESFPHSEIRLREYELRDLIAQSAYMEEVQDKDEGFAFGVLRLSSEIVLVKSCGGIEDKYTDYLSKLSERRVLFTGVLVPKPEGEGLEIMKWLRERKPRSVLYISFGSENYLSKEQMVEIAKGLEKSDVGFIWVARPPAGEAARELPEGFEERTKKRGVVVREWAVQAAILADEGVGGFMTHCGWSSVSESVWFGVPVVGMPLKYDQTVNARMVVEAGIGVEVARGGNGEIDGGAVAEAVEKVMGKGGEVIRRRVGEWRKKMEIEEVGAIDQVVKELSRLCANK